ncbi:MAG TPA: thioesterase family protein [Ottowia sp.]|mgnify:FL=1|jgi:4-hydroxybenzoyl-CoA thioesterase|nr:MAG: 4-hydroxybenzoyl-CoA thioesterase [Burkholderiales bacterium 68-10]HMT84331.1 thioesterase family protein [Ottowia sp.]HOK11479.1 thioesterase family protein [Ottowia sp.]HQX68065.1 thioesterase family protein [Ottowia sp.]HRB10109.1 thioesterase family protein [Ottowia sp.]
MQHADPSPAARFERVYPIRFSHCDPAGIVFFPQYLVLFNHLVEDWFTEGLGVDYAQMLGARRIGLPIVRLECDFRAISRMGDAVTFGLVTERVGGRSLTLALTARVADELRVTARQVLVFTDLDTHRAIDLPADVRAALAAGR